MTKGRIAFINCRTYSGGSNIHHMPFAFNMVLKLASQWDIDLILGSAPDPEILQAIGGNVKVRYVHKHLARPFLLREALLMASCMRLGYRAVFGMGQVGTYLAYLLSKLNRCPLFTLSDEYPSCFGRTRWTARDARAHQHARAIIVPDKNRFAGLCREIPSISGSPNFELLNVPLERSAAIPQINWHERLGLPPDVIPLICVGGIGEHNQIPELLASVKSWPEKYVLIIRGNNPTYGIKYLESLRHLNLPGRIFWLFEPLTTEEFESLMCYCSISFALYRYEGPNMIEMGKASGKLLRSVSLGIPVISSAFPSLSFVEEHGLGKLVNHPAEIADAITFIMSRHELLKQRCHVFAEEALRYETGWQEFSRFFEKALG